MASSENYLMVQFSNKSVLVANIQSENSFKVTLSQLSTKESAQSPIEKKTSQFKISHVETSLVVYLEEQRNKCFQYTNGQV